MTQGERGDLPKILVTFFSKILSPIFAFRLVGYWDIVFGEKQSLGVPIYVTKWHMKEEGA